MRKFLTALGFSLLGLSAQAEEAKSVVVVELYTSQGCSSCPPADAVLAEVAQHDNVIALGLHVDYWDYLGWKDELAIPAFTERQAHFNTQMQSRYRLVTPQMIFQGQDYVAGTNRSKAHHYVEKLGQMAERAQLEVKNGENGTIDIRLTAIDADTPAADLHLVRFIPEVSVDIRAGENRGRQLTYINTVTSWETIETWDGSSDLELSYPVTGEDAVALIVQAEGMGPILTARQLVVATN